MPYGTYDADDAGELTQTNDTQQPTASEPPALTVADVAEIDQRLPVEARE